MLVLKFLQSVIKCDHSGLHFVDCRLRGIFELIYFLQLSLLSFHHKHYLFIQRFFVFMKLFCTLQNLFIQSTLQLIKLIDLLLIDCYHCLHPFDSALVFNVIFSDFFSKFRYFIVLELYISRFVCVFSLEEEFMVFEFFQYVSLSAFDLIDLYGILSLFFIKGLKQFTHNFSNFGLHLIPFKLSYLRAVFFILLLFTSHYFIIIKKIILDQTIKGLSALYHSLSPDAACSANYFSFWAFLKAFSLAMAA